MGKYDQFLVGLSSGASPSSSQPSGKYEKFVSGVGSPAKEMGGKPPLSFVLGEISKMQPTEKISQGLKTLAGNTAERMSMGGIPPKVAATAMLPLAILPEVLGAASSLGILEGPSVAAQAIRNTPRMLSPKYEALNEAAGISKDLPIRRGTLPKFPGLNGLPSNVPPPQVPTISPKVYPNDTNGFLNFARARLEGLGEQLSPQELNDYKSMINTAINEGKIAPGTDQFAIATRLLKEKVTPLLNSVVPGRSELDQIYALSKKLRIAPEIAKKVWAFLGPKLRYGVIGVP